MRIAISETLAKAGMAGAIGLRYSGPGVIFMLHSVVDDDTAYLKDPLRCPAERLEAALKWAIAQNIDLVSLDEATCRLASGDDRQFAAFTFDDGYRDNLTVALPIMERYGAPLTIYITTAMLTGELYAWWDAIIPLIRDNDTVEIEPMNQRFELQTEQAKNRTVKAIKRWIHADGTRAELLRPVFNRYGIAVEALVKEHGSTHEDIKTASTHPLITIGAHTHSHPFLNLLPLEIANTEITRNKNELQSTIDKTVDHFAYPYGAAGPREAKLVKAAGFKTAVTTTNGTVFPTHMQADSRFALPREPIDPSDTEGCLYCRTKGVYRFLKSRGGDPAATF